MLLLLLLVLLLFAIPLLLLLLLLLIVRLLLTTKVTLPTCRARMAHRCCSRVRHVVRRVRVVVYRRQYMLRHGSLRA